MITYNILLVFSHFFIFNAGVECLSPFNKEKIGLELLLKEVLLSHRWVQVAHLLTAMSQELVATTTTMKVPLIYLPLFSAYCQIKSRADDWGVCLNISQCKKKTQKTWMYYKNTWLYSNWSYPMAVTDWGVANSRFF